MAKISTYGSPSVPVATDLLIGSDVNDSYSTKNFAISTVLNLTNKGVFYDNTTQTTTINTATAVLLANTNSSLTSGFSITNNVSNNPTRITASSSSIYNIIASLQVSNTSGTDGIVDIWIRINGTDVAYSNMSATVKANSNFSVINRNFVVSLSLNQYVEIMWSTTNASIQLLTSAATGVHPANPSAFVRISQS